MLSLRSSLVLVAVVVLALVTPIAAQTACSTLPVASEQVDLTIGDCKNAATTPVADGGVCVYGCKIGFGAGAKATCANGVWSLPYCVGFALPTQVYVSGKLIPTPL